jgi:hypothetical protein
MKNVFSYTELSGKQDKITVRYNYPIWKDRSWMIQRTAIGDTLGSIKKSKAKT